jgi:hypothetical protein
VLVERTFKDQVNGGSGAERLPGLPVAQSVMLQRLPSVARRVRLVIFPQGAAVLLQELPSLAILC